MVPRSPTVTRALPSPTAPRAHRNHDVCHRDQVPPTATRRSRRLTAVHRRRQQRPLPPTATTRAATATPIPPTATPLPPTATPRRRRQRGHGCRRSRSPRQRRCRRPPASSTRAGLARPAERACIRQPAGIRAHSDLAAGRRAGRQRILPCDTSRPPPERRGRALDWPGHGRHRVDRHRGRRRVHAHVAPDVQRCHGGSSCCRRTIAPGSQAKMASAISPDSDTRLILMQP